MYPEDRVLVAVMPNPRDLIIAREQHWYRIPQKKAPRGIYAEYIAFYFTKAFGEMRWAVHFYARRLGHELVRRIDLLPDEPDHPRAYEPYFKIQLGPLQRKEPPILSSSWRRITFIHTTWDRFIVATDIRDLFSKDKKFVDRVYHALREVGIKPRRDLKVKEGGVTYEVDMAVECRNGIVVATTGEGPPDSILLPGGGDRQVKRSVEEVRRAVEALGGVRTLDVPLE